MKYILFYVLSIVGCLDVFASDDGHGDDVFSDSCIWSFISLSHDDYCRGTYDYIKKEYYDIKNQFNDEYISNVYQRCFFGNIIVISESIKFCKLILGYFAETGVGLRVEGDQLQVVKKDDIDASYADDVSEHNVAMIRKAIDMMPETFVHDYLSKLLKNISHIDNDVCYAISFLRRLLEIDMLYECFRNENKKTSYSNKEKNVKQEIVSVCNVVVNMVGFITTFDSCLKLINNTVVFDSSLILGEDIKDMLLTKKGFHKVNLPYMKMAPWHKKIHLFSLFVIENVFQYIMRYDSIFAKDFVATYTMLHDVSMARICLYKKELIVSDVIIKRYSILLQLEKFLICKLGKYVTSLILEFFCNTQTSEIIVRENADVYNLQKKNLFFQNVKPFLYKNITFQYSKTFGFYFDKEADCSKKMSCYKELKKKNSMLYIPCDARRETVTFIFDALTDSRTSTCQTSSAANLSDEISEKFCIQYRAGLSSGIIKHTPTRLHITYNMKLALLFFEKMVDIIVNIDVPKLRSFSDIDLNFNITKRKKADMQEVNYLYSEYKPKEIKKSYTCSTWDKYFAILYKINYETNYGSLIPSIKKIPRAIQATLIARFIKDKLMFMPTVQKHHEYAEIYISMYFFTLCKIHGLNLERCKIKNIGFVDFCLFINSNTNKNLVNTDNIAFKRYSFSEILLYSMCMMIFISKYDETQVLESGNNKRQNLIKRKLNKIKYTLISDVIERTLWYHKSKCLFNKSTYAMICRYYNNRTFHKLKCFSLNDYVNYINQSIMQHTDTPSNLLRCFEESQEDYGINNSFSIQSMIKTVEDNIDSFINCANDKI